MRYSIVYSSRTGNTRQLAQAIQDRLPNEQLVYCGAPSGEALAAEVLFVGFWTDKGSCDPDTEAFLAQTAGKTVFLFGTAGFGQSQDYFDQILARVQQKLPADAKAGGGFMCQGRMPQAVRQRYQAMLEKEPDNQRYQLFLANFDQALAHPGPEDLAAAGDWAERCLG